MFKTTMYNLALFQVMVPSAVGYTTIAHFLCESENSEDIGIALLTLREWMSQDGLHWPCEEFMSDKSAAIYNALEHVFPGVLMFLHVSTHFSCVSYSFSFLAFILYCQIVKNTCAVSTAKRLG